MVRMRRLSGIASANRRSAMRGISLFALLHNADRDECRRSCVCASSDAEEADKIALKQMTPVINALQMAAADLGRRMGTPEKQTGDRGFEEPHRAVD